MDRALGWFFRLFNRGFDAASRGYVGVVRRVVRRSARRAASAYVGLLVLTWLGFAKVPTGFIPAQDKGYLVAVRAAARRRLARAHATTVVRRMSTRSRSRRRASSTPSPFPGLSIAGRTQQRQRRRRSSSASKPFDERRATSRYGAGDRRRRCSEQVRGRSRTPSSRVFPPPPVQGLGTAGGFKLHVQDRGGRGPATRSTTARRS